MALSKEEREEFLAQPHIAAYVAVDGPVSRIEPRTDDQLVELSRRYMPPERVGAYLDYARNELGESVVIYLQSQHWLSADLGEL